MVTRIRIVAAGRLRAGPELVLTERYLDRFAKIGRQVGLGLEAVCEAVPRADGRLETIPRSIEAGGVILTCDQSGHPITSDGFARLIARYRDASVREILLVIGGPDGIAASLQDRADQSLSFGNVIFPHLLFRVLLAEQLCRAASILAGLPYHRV